MTPFARTRDDLAACVLLYAIGAASLADYGLTVHGLAIGAQELNPLMARMFEAGNGYAFAVKTGLPIACMLAYLLLRKQQYSRRFWLWALLGVAAISLAPVAWNLYMLGRMR